MKIRSSIIILILCVFQFCIATATEPTKYAIKAGKILTVTKGAINDGIILLDDRVIKAVGTAAKVKIPEDYTLIDASDKWVMPGMVEIHSHIGAEGGINDMVVPTNPELRVMDNIDPESWELKLAIASGVTTIHTIPGSGTNLAGFGVLYKPYGKTIDEMLIRPLGTMKVSQAYNPERRGGDLGLTRMGMSWILRDILEEAKEYTKTWEAYQNGERTGKPTEKPELEQMRKAFQRAIPVLVHTASACDVMATARIFHDEFQLSTIVSHATFHGYKVADEMAKRDVHVNVGPRMYDFSFSQDNKFYGLAAEYESAGVKNLSITTDGPVVPQEELFYQVTMAVRLGLDEKTALEGVTINPARAMGIDDRVGSIEIGKDADLSLWIWSLSTGRLHIGERNEVCNFNNVCRNYYVHR
jgi:imidazolonepropionase-like amidohydrolase